VVLQPVVSLIGKSARRLRQNATVFSRKGRTRNMVCRDRGPETEQTLAEFSSTSEIEGPRSSGAAELRISRRGFLAGTVATVLMGGWNPARAEDIARTPVGIILPEDGPFAADAKSLMAGFELYVKEKAATAPKLDVVTMDPGRDDGKILEVIADLVMKQKVPFLVAPPSLEGTEKAIHALSGEKVVTFITNPHLRFVSGERCSSTMFRLRANSFQAAQPLAPWALKNVGLKAFITGDDVSVKNEEADAFAYGIERFGGVFVDRIMIRPESDDLDTVLTAIEKSSADFVFAAVSDDNVPRFIDAYRAKSGIRQPLLGPDSLTGFPQTVEALGKRCAGIRTLGCVKDPQGLVKRIRETLRRDVSDVTRAAEGYDIAAAVCQAIAGIPGESDPVKYAQFIEKAEIDGPRGKIRFDANHDPLMEVLVQEWVPEGIGKDKDKGKEKAKSKEKAKGKDHAIHKAKGFKRTIVAELGVCHSLDFGCGRVGFPKGPDSEKEVDSPASKEDDLFFNGE
jgi:ABC-type branched-subunit amino acid transport system substrate-binding protein